MKRSKDEEAPRIDQLLETIRNWDDFRDRLGAEARFRLPSAFIFDEIEVKTVPSANKAKGRFILTQPRLQVISA